MTARKDFTDMLDCRECVSDRVQHRPWRSTRFCGDYGRFVAAFPATLDCMRKAGYAGRGTGVLLQDAILLQNIWSLHMDLAGETSEKRVVWHREGERVWMRATSGYLSRMSLPAVPLDFHGSKDLGFVGGMVPGRISVDGVRGGLARLRGCGLLDMRKDSAIALEMSNRPGNEEECPDRIYYNLVSLDPAVVDRLAEKDPEVPRTDHPLAHVVNRVFEARLDYEWASVMSAWHYFACACCLLKARRFRDAKLFRMLKGRVWMRCKSVQDGDGWFPMNPFMPHLSDRRRQYHVTAGLAEAGWLDMKVIRGNLYVALPEAVLCLLQGVSDAVCLKKGLSDPNPCLWYSLPADNVRKAIVETVKNVRKMAKSGSAIRRDRGYKDVYLSLLVSSSMYSSFTTERWHFLRNAAFALLVRIPEKDPSKIGRNMPALTALFGRLAAGMDGLVKQTQAAYRKNLEEREAHLESVFKDNDAGKFFDIRREVADRNTPMLVLEQAARLHSEGVPVGQDDVDMAFMELGRLPQVVRMRTYMELPYFIDDWGTSLVHMGKMQRFTIPEFSAGSLKEDILEAFDRAFGGDSRYGNMKGFTKQAVLHVVMQELRHVWEERYGKSAMWLVHRLFKPVVDGMNVYGELGQLLLGCISFREDADRRPAARKTTRYLLVCDNRGRRTEPAPARLPDFVQTSSTALLFDILTDRAEPYLKAGRLAARTPATAKYAGNRPAAGFMADDAVRMLNGTFDNKYSGKVA